MPSNTFTHEWALRECGESESECRQNDKKDPNGTIFGPHYGIHIPYRGNLIQCFSVYKDDCRAFIGIKYLGGIGDIDLDPEEEFVIDVEYITAGCRTVDLKGDL